MGKRVSLKGKKRGRSTVMSPMSGSRSNRSGARLLLRPWLEHHLNSNGSQILRWVNRSLQIFSISWCHASKHGFSESEHGDLFFRWVQYKGNSKKKGCSRNHTANKATFRCALNSLKDCIELTKDGDKKGIEAKRTYQFIEPDHPLYDRKRKARRLKKDKNQSQEELPNCKYDLSSESSIGTWEQDTSTWEHFRTEGVSPASDGSLSSPSAAQIIEDNNNTYVIPENLLPSTLTFIPEDSLLSSLADSSATSAHIPNLKDLLSKIPLKNNKSIKEVKPEVPLELEFHDSGKDILENPAAENCSPGESNSYEVPFCHSKLNTGGNVRVQNINQETRSHFGIIINISNEKYFTFAEIDNGCSVEIQSDDIEMDSMEDCNEVLTDKIQYVAENVVLHPYREGDLTDLQPLDMLDEESHDTEQLDEHFENLDEDLSNYICDENGIFPIDL